MSAWEVVKAPFKALQTLTIDIYSFVRTIITDSYDEAAKITKGILIVALLATPAACEKIPGMPKVKDGAYAISKGFTDIIAGSINAIKDSLPESSKPKEDRIDKSGEGISRKFELGNLVIAKCDKSDCIIRKGEKYISEVDGKKVEFVGCVSDGVNIYKCSNGNIEMYYVHSEKSGNLLRATTKKPN